MQKIKVVKFTKEKCPHCKIFEPIFKKEIDSFKDKIDFYEISLDDHQFFREIFNIRGVPSLYTFESNDFETFENIEQLVIGHSHEQYSSLVSSLKKLVQDNDLSQAQV